MLDILFIALLLCNLYIVVIYLRYVHPRDGFIGPLLFVLPFYILNYPIRAVILFLARGSSWAWQVDKFGYHFQLEEILFALAYATLFMGSLIAYYAQLCQRRKQLYRSEAFPASGLSGQYQQFVFLCFFSAYVFLFVYKLESGELTRLYESIYDLKRPFIVNFLNLIESLKWFLMAYGGFRYLREKSFSALVMVLSISAIIVFSALASTGKGDLVTLALVLGSCFWFVKGKFPKYTMVVFTVVVLFFALYSFTARQYAYMNVRSTQGNPISNTLIIVETVRDAFASGNVRVKETFLPIFSRFNGMDGLLMCQRKNTFLEDNLYVAGSIVEFGNLIPRPIWPDRPHLSFNHHITSTVWGLPGRFAEMPIGRIGESFFVLNWGGLFYAFLYAFFWNWLYVKFLVQAKDDLKRALYVCLVCLVVMPDAYLVYNWKSVVVVVLSYFAVRLKMVRRRPIRAECNGSRKMSNVLR